MNKKILSVIISISMLMSAVNALNPAYAEESDNSFVFENTEITADIVPDEIAETEEISKEFSTVSEDDFILFSDEEVQLMAKIFDGGNGTENDPYIISTLEQLEIVRDLPSYCYKLKNDIELSDEWKPIGYDGEDFSGVFDGNGYTISGLNSGEYKFKGLFRVNNGTIKNLNIEVNQTNTVDDSYIASIAANNDDNGIIENCSAKGKITAEESYSYGYYYSITVGGLVAVNHGTIKESYANVDLNVNCRSDESYSGGFVGYNNEGKIEDCYCIGDVSATNEGNAGGFVGYNYGNITNSYAVCGIEAGNKKGGFCAYKSSNGSIINSYYDSKVSGCSDTGGGEPKTSLGMKLENTYTDWDFEDIWCFDDDINDGYPSLQWQSANSRINVTDVSLNKTSITLGYGESTALTANVKPSDATNKKVKWSSSDESVATVNSDGTVTAYDKSGMTIITVTTIDGEFTAQCVVTVKDTAVKVTGVTLDKTSCGIKVGDSAELNVTVTPSDAEDKSVSWISSNTNVATVTQSGKVVGVSSGTAVITVRSSSEPSCSDSCTVTVTENNIAVKGIAFDIGAFSDELPLDIGSTLTLKTKFTPANATNQNIIWTSSDKSIATVSNGIVVGVSEGVATITATAEDGGYQAKCSVKVTPPIIAVNGVALKNNELTVEVKGTKQLEAVVTPTDATDKSLRYESSNNAIATISQSGLITGISPGTTLIKAIAETDYGTFVGYCTVTVSKPVVDVKSIKLNKGNLSVVEGKTVPLDAVIKPINATNKNIIWSSSDEGIATVSQEGYVTAKSVGECVVSATSESNNNISTQCHVVVLSADTPAQITVDDALVKAGMEVPVTVSITANPGISTFAFKLKYDNTKIYPVSYTKNPVLNTMTVTTPLGNSSFENKSEVTFLCMTGDTRNDDTDGDMITVIFRSREGCENQETEIELETTEFTDENYNEKSFQNNNGKISITDYIIGDVNCDNVVDFVDVMILAQTLSGYDTEISDAGSRAAAAIYPDGNENFSVRDLQHLFRYLADWQVELGKEN